MATFNSSNKKPLNPQPTRLKTRAEIEAREAFIKGQEVAIECSNWAFVDLKGLSREELLSRLQRVDKQATLMKWRVYAALRAQFKSDKLYGQYLKVMRENPEYAGLIGSQQDIDAASKAGTFCERHRIYDLDAVGLSAANWNVWSKSNIAENSFFSYGVDFIELITTMSAKTPNPPKDYAVTIEFAKQ